MALVALVMAGGRGERLKSDVEKPLLAIGRKPMIQRVIEALLASPSVSRVVVAISPNTPKTREYLRSIKGITVLETSGTSYHEDMKEAIRRVQAGHFLVLSADLPLITPNVVEEIIKRYFEMKKPALTVVLPLDKYLMYGMEATYVIKIDGIEYVPCGVNVIDRSRVEEPYIEEAFYVPNTPGAFINVNTPQEYIKVKNQVQTTIKDAGVDDLEKGL
ncbi:MAG: NTP transferase domain-containing protein [Candidatus Methanomethylicaceae archaeon]